MKITFQGNFSFSLKGEKEELLLLNPQENKNYSDKLILSIFSEQNFQENFQKKPVVNWPGEFEFKEITVKSFATRENGLGQIFRFEDINFGFLGDLKKLISQEKMEPLSNTDVLFLPKTNDGMSNKDLKKLIEEIDPRIVILAGEENLFNELLKELGASSLERKESFTISKSKLPSDHTEFIALMQEDI